MTGTIHISPPSHFSLSIPQSDIDSLYTQISHTPSSALEPLSVTDSNSLSPQDFTYGFPPVLLQNLIARLNGGYDWRAFEKRMQDMGDHYMSDVSGVEGEGTMRLHFVRIRSEKDGASPILLLHGWPGDFFEFEKAGKLLSRDFDVVIPSLPGYAFSSGPRHPHLSFSFGKTAQLMDALMSSLGFSKYFVQGGDWGNTIARRIAQLFPDRVLGLHVNFLGGASKAASSSDGMDDNAKAAWTRFLDFRHHGLGYFWVMGSVPYTIGPALSFHPLSLLAFLGEKWYRWSTYPNPMPTDEILTHILLYWFSGSITSSMWYYYILNHEEGSEDLKEMKETQISAPFAFTCGKYEMNGLTIEQAKLIATDIKVFKVLDKGSHFLAAEEPELFAKEVGQFFKKIEEEIK
ncbi:alpha/beta-hydrolase [Atractiella rhizophila]|nr:alpha/beta-hydrolase [Atractiella rhizophila]